jgi:spore coat protein JB
MSHCQCTPIYEGYDLSYNSNGDAMPLGDFTYSTNAPWSHQNKFDATTMAISQNDYQKYMNMMKVAPTRIRYYITGIYPTPHDTVTIPMSPEYQTLFAEIDQLHQMGRTHHKAPTERDSMLYEIQLLTTTLINYNLYLDVFPTNQEALMYFNQYQNELKTLVNEYERRYHPLSLDSDALRQSPWRWLEGPWPWEGRMS